ncbi:hypothetical protein Hypma_016310 [Hypsizygus marmoreus]|uniref:LysM domain-containing protein n=1 Tax=Hypsizygus marmoreus TaxID=39966 RepID=A0A369J4R6_HYPMA|nr:hypothetical protein Hypma_016310 [Hypsizygus marmoreus]
MFLSSSLWILLIFALLARADVFPNEPAGGIYRSGTTCRIGWAGDTTSSTAWKDMTIQLMTGDNFNMVHITTVATGRDGTVDGSFSWICPEVTPNSAIYFYQFRSPHTPNYQWTTRFTIASSTGQTTPPSENIQPDGAHIPWGTGALKDPSAAVPAPVFPSPTTTTTTVPTPTATPSNVAPGVVSGCTGFFTETNLLCWQIVSQFGITLENFEAWNGGANVCNILQTGLAYCIARPTPTGSSPVPTPTNVAPSVVTGCTAFFTETNLLCYEIAERFGITVTNFQAWNGGANVCNVLETGLAYCVAAQPANAAPGVIAGCTSFFTETNLLCYEIAAQYGITVGQFQSWNGGSNVCNVLEPGLAYCIAGPTTTTPAPSVPTPTNVASGVVAGCMNFYTETDLLCYQIAANFGITVAQFEAWNGAGVCNVLQTGKAYCVAGP